MLKTLPFSGVEDTKNNKATEMKTKTEKRKLKTFYLRRGWNTSRPRSLK